MRAPDAPFDELDGSDSEDIADLPDPTPSAAAESGRPANLAAALTSLQANTELDREVLRHVASDLKVAAKLCGRKLEQLPCDPVQLRPILRAVMPARYRLTGKRWSSIKSSIARVLRTANWLDAAKPRGAPLWSDWQAGADAIAIIPAKAVFRAFALWCQERGLHPAQVDAASLESYRAWRATRTLQLDLTHCIATLRSYWNRLVRTCATWQACRLLPPPGSRHLTRPATTFPLSFQQELAALLQRMASFRPLDPRATRKYAPVTIYQAERSILQAVSTLVRLDRPAETIASLRDVLLEPSLRLVLTDYAQRLGSDGGWPPSAISFAITLRRAAMQCGLLNAEEQRAVAALVRLVPNQPFGLKATARERLAQFDPVMIGRLLRLPQQCFLEADGLLAQGHAIQAARHHQRALLLAIHIRKPLRLKNLTELDLARDFLRDAKDRVIDLRIPGSETKTGRDSEAAFDKDLIRRFDKHLKTYRPLLNRHGSSYLFPGAKGGHLTGAVVARTLKQLVGQRLGVRFNPHLMRHLAVDILLREDPNNMPVAQHVLDHATLKTTERMYGQARTRGAQKLWARTLERELKKAKRKGRSS